MKKKIVKVLILGAFAVALNLPVAGQVMAKTVRETEPNDSMEEAEEIQCSRKTMQDYLNASNSNSVVVKGTVSKNNDDWYKVYIESDKDTYFSINADPIYYSIYDSEGDLIVNRDYISDASRA